MTHFIIPSNYLFYLIASILAFLLLFLWVTKTKRNTESDKSKEEPPEKVKEGTHVVNQMDIVLGHIEVYGSICSNEAKALYGIKNLKAVIHKIRSKMKVEIVNIYHTGTKRFFGYGINK